MSTKINSNYINKPNSLCARPITQQSSDAGCLVLSESHALYEFITSKTRTCVIKWRMLIGQVSS